MLGDDGKTDSTISGVTPGTILRAFENDPEEDSRVVSRKSSSTSSKTDTNHQSGNDVNWKDQDPVDMMSYLGGYMSDLKARCEALERENSLLREENRLLKGAVGTTF